MQLQLGHLLRQIARPHRCDETLPAEVRASLRQIGVPCDESTPRTDLIVRLWARKRTMLRHTPPSAA
jgi:hypothetical protein